MKHVLIGLQLSIITLKYLEVLTASWWFILAPSLFAIHLFIIGMVSYGVMVVLLKKAGIDLDINK